MGDWTGAKLGGVPGALVGDGGLAMGASLLAGGLAMGDPYLKGGVATGAATDPGGWATGASSLEGGCAIGAPLLGTARAATGTAVLWRAMVNCTRYDEHAWPRPPVSECVQCRVFYVVSCIQTEPIQTSGKSVSTTVPLARSVVLLFNSSV
jgi:hypothetical protein